MTAPRRPAPPDVFEILTGCGLMLLLILLPAYALMEGLA